MPNITLAVAEDGIQELIKKVTDSFHISTSGSTSGNFRVDYNAGIKLHGGKVNLRDNPDELVIRELDIVYDPLSVTIKIDIPKITIGGFCLIPPFNTPWGCVKAVSYTHLTLPTILRV